MDKLTNFFIATESNNYRPPVLSYKAFLIYGVVLIILRFLLGSVWQVQGAAVESSLLMQLVNQERRARNIPALLTSQKLVSASSLKSQDMIDRDYFDHVDPDGNYVWGKIVASGYSPYKILGENLAVDFATSEGMVKAWIESPTHRTNLLHTSFLDQGLAALYGDFQGRYTNLTTSLFGTLLTQEPQPRSAATTNPSPLAPTPPLPARAPQGPSDAIEQAPEQTLPPPEPAPLPPPARAPSGQPTEPTQTSPSPLALTRNIFTLFGIALLFLLTTDSVIIYRKAPLVVRSHSSYHLLSFALIVLVSILIWWW